MQMHKAGTILSLVNPLQHISSPLQRRSTRQLCVCVKAWRTAGESDSQNPLELLRVCKNPRERAALLRALDDSWAQAVEAYRPSSVEIALQKELGIWEQTVMQLALSQPDLVELQADEQVKPALRAMKAAGMGSQDIWFLVQKRGVFLLSIPVTLQRWLDFISVYGLTPRGIQNFLLRAPETLFQDTTLYQAGQVVSYLRTLGLADEYLAQRVFPVWPEVLARDVESDLRPVVTFLLTLGIEAAEVTRIMSAWPELLLARVDTQLAPWACYLEEELGASGTQVAEIIRLCPHLIGLTADDVFGKRIRSLGSVGLGKEDLASMTAKSLRWVTASGGVQQPLDFLVNKAGFSKQEVHALLLEAPDILAEKDHELERKWAFITQVLGSTKDEVAACPQVMAHNLNQVLGPRHGFLEKQGKLGLLTKGAMQDGADPVAHKPGMYDLAKLALPTDDVEWCLHNQVSIMDLSRYRAHWEHEGGDILMPVVKLSPAEELAAELRKLGITQL